MFKAFLAKMSCLRPLSPVEGIEENILIIHVMHNVAKTEEEFKDQKFNNLMLRMIFF